MKGLKHQAYFPKNLFSKNRHHSCSIVIVYTKIEKSCKKMKKFYILQNLRKNIQKGLGRVLIS
ncbi:hypothetical protein BIV59_08625 [Bacillus sp. MUM 13]|nr:hypothetical protein BIV59_08625 [Bacillus sp. MUM 13]